MNLSGCFNLPEGIDFSPCSEVDLSFCELSDGCCLKFAENSKVILNETQNIPHDTDFSGQTGEFIFLFFGRT